MTKMTKYLGALLVFLALSLGAVAWQVTGDENTGYRMKVVTRSTEAVDYHHKGSTRVDLKGTDLMPEATGKAEVEGRAGDVKVEAQVEHLRPANTFGLAYLTYVLWAISPQGRPRNLGELVLHDGKSSVKASSDFQAFALIVTAEPFFAVTQPSDLVVAQNVIRQDTKGGVEPVNVTYELISRDTYNAQVKPIDSSVYDVSHKTPLDLLEARNAVRIAKDAQADQYASSTLQRAQDLLNQAEDYYRRKQGNSPIGTVAREASQTAEEARVMATKRKQEEEAAQERRAGEAREAQARADAEAQQAAAAQARAQAESEAQQRQQADAQRASAEQAQLQAEQARQQAEAAQQQAAQQAQQADLQRQQAEQARLQAEQARQQAENDKAQMRARMLQQLNQVLATKDSARGLIVSMPDVLFDTGKANLKPAARERLAKVAGILLAYPDIHVEIDGHTDSTGSLEFNERLSQQRAESVRTYLSSQGVNQSIMNTQGFGPSQPVASNATAAGRQQNRRVELVVSGGAIGEATGAANQPDQNTAPARASNPPGQAAPAQPAPQDQTAVPAGQTTVPQR